MSESLKKKGIRSQGLFPLFFFYQNGTPSCKERKQLLVSLRRPGSAEKAQFFGVFRSNGGKRDATVKCESRLRGGMKKTRKNTCAPQNRRNFLRFSNKQRQEGSEHEEWVTHERRGTKKERQNQLYPHQLFKLFFPQTPAETTTNMVLCRGNIFSKEMTFTSKHILQCERHLQEGDIFERK